VTEVAPVIALEEIVVPPIIISAPVSKTCPTADLIVIDATDPPFNATSSVPTPF
jgi:hypothetical protein